MSNQKQLQKIVTMLFFCSINHLMGTLKPQSNGPLYTGRDWWTGSYIWYTEEGPAQSPPRCTKCSSQPINGQCTNFILFDVALQIPLDSKRLINKCSQSNNNAHSLLYSLKQSDLYEHIVINVLIKIFDVFKILSIHVLTFLICFSL